MESASSISNRISSLSRDIKTLENKVIRLESTRTDAVSRRIDMITYMSSVEHHKDSINAAFGSFSWEGQTVKDFKRIYSNAVYYLGTTVLPMYERLISDINDEIIRLKSIIEVNKGQISSWNVTLSQLSRNNRSV